MLVAADEKIADEVFNVGFQNMSIMEIAEVVKKVVQEEFPERGELEIVTTPSDDIRSYHINSDKIKRVLGFEPQHSIEEAVRDLCRAFRDGKLPDSFDNDGYYNVRTMQAIGAE
jgi:nucleoside-diphosphate-sugar epimerase